MDYQHIFAEYYVQYRGDSTIPSITDPEWAIAAFYGNSAIRRFANVDAEMWDFLWTTAVAEGFSNTYQGTSSAPTLTTYTCPDNMKAPGGFVTLTDPVSRAYIQLEVVQVRNVQFQAQGAPYAYFVGNPQQGFVLYLSFSGSSNTGWIINFPMYKKPTYFDVTPTANSGIAEDGSTVTEVPDASFIINYILTYRFRSSRNFPAYQTAKKDAEESLKGMQLKNGTGINGNVWNLNDSNMTGSFGS